ncbi:MAG TPA: ABC transporter permease [Gaiellaceae bacterium]|nr:ABC transporter permease [Gaiellaceae bacterium]
MASADAQAVAVAAPPRRRRASARLLRRLARQPAGLAAGIVLVVIFVVGALVPVITPHWGVEINLSQRWLNHPPMAHGWYFLGTDGIGRSVAVRTLYGLHTSEQSAVFATVLATLIGVAIGSVAGYRGGWADALVMRLADMLSMFPALLLLLAIYTWFQPVTVWKATIILACYLWIPAARVVRAEVSSLKHREFVQTALSLGASDRWIFFRHLLPNASSAIIVAATSLLGQMVMLEATVEFFGLGVPSGIEPTLGNLIGDGQRNVIALGWGWWNWAAPAMLLVVIIVCANLVGDGVADALRPTRRR